MKLFKRILLGVFLVSTLWGAITFPVLHQSRIVDEAGLFTATQKEAIESRLATHERSTTDQIVVVTLASLQGYDIADFGYQLGRAWGIGTKERNNGVLLIIAPNERKVRIEVGYGLEGALPDAIANTIIHNSILPSFKQKNYFEGTQNGINAMIAAINGEYTPPTQTKAPSSKSSLFGTVVTLIFFCLFILLAAFSHSRQAKPKKVLPSLFLAIGVGAVSWFIFTSVGVSLFLACVAFVLSYFGASLGNDITLQGTQSSGSNSSGSFGGFSGGGGSFGGGGASGSW